MSVTTGIQHNNSEKNHRAHKHKQNLKTACSMPSITAHMTKNKLPDYHEKNKQKEQRYRNENGELYLLDRRSMLLSGREKLERTVQKESDMISVH